MYGILSDALLIDVHVTPRSSRTVIKGVYDGRIKILVNSPPIEGRANDALIEFLAEILDVAKRDLSIIRGGTSRQKTVRLKTTRPLDFQKKLDEFLASARTRK